MVHEIIRRKEHLTEDGLRKILALKAAMNLGLSAKLKTALPDVVRVERPLHKLPTTIEPEWLTGFTDADGSFIIKLVKSQRYKLGETVQLVFQLAQHSRDEALLILIIEYLGCGYLYKHSENAVIIRVINFNDIVTIIIPFFKKYKIRGMKALDFEDWCKAAELMKEKKHLTAEGLEEIKQIKTGMNTGRKN